MKQLFLFASLVLANYCSFATVIPVTNVNDAGAGSLRLEISNSSDGDTLKFDNSLITAGSVTLTLASEIAFSKALTIVGVYNSTDTLYISGNNNSRIFGITNTGAVTLDSLVLINGNSIGASINGQGGAILCFNTSDTLHILNSICSNNSAFGNGGAIYTRSSSNPITNLNNSSISNNSANDSGGGIFSYFNGQHGTCNIVVNNSTINNNSSSNRGGGICLYIPAVYTAVSILTINNSTITNNSSNYGGGIYSYARTSSSGFAFNSISSLIISNSTISDNVASNSGNGIYAYAFSNNNSANVVSTIDLISSIVANSSTNFFNTHTPTITSSGYNIFSDNPNGAIGAGDQVNIIAGLNLQPLALNGGTTLTMLPGAGSVAINMGNPSDVTDAQNRTFTGNSRDVGAAETTCFTSPSTHNETVCFGESIIVNGTTYDASNLSGTEVFANVGVSNCDSIVTVNLAIVPELTSTHNETVCFGESIIVNGTTYDASNLSGTEVFTNIGPNNCDSTVSVNLTIVPELIGTYNDTLCPGGSIDINGTIYDSNNLTGVEVFTNVGPNNCDSTVTVNLTVTDVYMPIVSNVILATTTAECYLTPNTPTATDNCAGLLQGVADVAFPLTTLGSTLITWTYDDGNGNIVTQTQTAIVTDSYVPLADEVNLTDVTATCELASLIVPTATDICAGTILATTTTLFPITTFGTTVVTWTYDDGNGNTSTQTQNVIIEEPIIDVTTTDANFVVSANNTSATSYQWIDCDNNNMPLSGETNTSYTAMANGNYAVIITEGSCSDTSDCVTIAGLGVDDDNDGLLNGVELYPNPNTGEFTIRTTLKNATVSIYGLDGKLVLSTIQINQPNQSINLGDIESGIYFVTVKNKSSQKTIRLIIQ